MHVNDDTHWHSHGCLRECMRHAVDVKVDDILDEHKHIHKEHIQSLKKNTHILQKKIVHFYNMLQLKCCSIT